MSKAIIKNITVLTVIALVSVFLLALVYQVTKGPIEEAAAKKQAAAYLSMYDDSCTLSKLEAEATGIADAMTVTKDGQTLGYAVTATGKGYGGDIRLAIRVDITEDGAAVINGLRVLYADDETQGFGAACKEESYWGAYTDSGKTEADAISGATLTTNGIREAIGYALDFAKQQAEGGAQ
ncbi:MAG: FMN-binding protein [Clostridia bacterium]|nr:FMN-binding protein [Clostridia bacterium]